MSLTVVGSIAFDAVKTPSGERDAHARRRRRPLRAGRVVLRRPSASSARSATTSATRSSPSCATRGVNTDDVERVAGGKTFFWAGRYERDLNVRDTLDTELNVFERFEPKLSEASRAADVLFLANIQPDLQLEVREQCDAARFVAMDSMNLWIDIARDSLRRDDRRWSTA